MNVLTYILDRIAAGKVHMTLIDPDKQSPAEAADLAATAAGSGTDAVMVGGSTGATAERTDATVRAVKGCVSIPVILFPAGSSGLSRHADAVYFMSLLNSRTPRMIVGEQKDAVSVIRRWGLEAIPMAYLIVEPGMRAGKVGRANPIPRTDAVEAVRYALAAQYMGMRLVYLEAGSGAPSPVPAAMISAVKRAVSIPVVVGGGIRTPAAAARVARAGADVVVTGTILETARRAAVLDGIVRAVKGL